MKRGGRQYRKRTKKVKDLKARITLASWRQAEVAGDELNIAQQAGHGGLWPGRSLDFFYFVFFQKLYIGIIQLIHNVVVLVSRCRAK